MATAQGMCGVCPLLQACDLEKRGRDQGHSAQLPPPSRSSGKGYPTLTAALALPAPVALASPLRPACRVQLQTGAPGLLHSLMVTPQAPGPPQHPRMLSPTARLYLRGAGAHSHSTRARY